MGTLSSNYPNSNAVEAALDRANSAAHEITLLSEDVAELQTSVSGKASQSDLEALQATVEYKADADDLTALAATVSNKADTADLTVLEAEVDTKADSSALTTAASNLQAQIDELITPVTQDAEVQNARVGADSISYQTLKARLDAEQLSVTSDISDLVDNKVSVTAYNRGYAVDNNIYSLWEQGHFNAQGEPGGSDATFYSQRIRTKGFIKKTDKLIVNTGYKYFVYKYLLDGTFVDSSGARTSDFSDFDFTTYKYKIMLGKSPDATVSVDIYKELLMLSEELVLEAKTARVDVNNVEYASLKDRLDAEQTETNNKISYLSTEKVSASSFDYGYALDFNKKSLWEQGHINNEGEPGSSESELYSQRIRTKDFIPAIDELRVNTNYIFFVYKYLLDGTFVESSAAKTGKYSNFDFSTYKYKVTFGKSSSVTPDDYYNAFLFKTQINSEVTNARVDINDTEYDSLKNRLDAEQASTKEITDYLTENKISADAYPYGYAVNLNIKSIWEQGHLDSEGKNGSSAALYYGYRIRTKGYINPIEKIVADTNHIFIVYKYDFSNEFIESSGTQTEWTDFDFTQYQYRVCIGRKPNPSNTNVNDDFNGVLFLKNRVVDESSPFDKHESIDFGHVPSSYYQGLGNDYTDFDGNTTYTEIIAAYDGLVTLYPDFLTKSELGLSSDNRMIYGYTFVPKRTGFYTGLRKKLPKVLLISAQHGFEKSSVYGIYYFLKDMLNRYNSNQTLEYIHDNVEIIIIPVCNPYGFDNNLYLNANGVNLNRNYLCDAWHESDPGTDQYGGDHPFSEPETQIVRDLVLNNLDAMIFIDYHTNGSGAVDDHKKINWHSYRTSDDEYYKKLEYASARHITRTTSMFSKDYGINFGIDLAGYIDSGNTTASSGKYAYDNGIPGMTFEGFNGFVGEESFTEREKKANSELIGNFLAETLRCYSNDSY